ncbi:hypothetical protein ACFV98_22510 [Streptomyces violascens]|uniref:hypothetical protein n=1 Tax=Streptomyces violascens TaxID=67381 RepID=UPI0036565965
MAKSPESIPPMWAAMLVPDDHILARLRSAGHGATRFVRCSGGRDAVVISPLQRGLSALDALGLPVEDGHAVLVDRSRHELIVIVDDGWMHVWDEVPGARVLPFGAWLLVPAHGCDGSLAAHWLSRPAQDIPMLWRDHQTEPSLAAMSAGVDARELRDALAAVDKARAAATVPS